MKIPGEAVLTGHLLVVEYLDADGSFHFSSECFGTGKEDLPLSKFLELIEYAKARALAPLMAEAVAEYYEENDYELVDVRFIQRQDDEPDEDEDEDEDELEDEHETDE